METEVLEKRRYGSIEDFNNKPENWETKRFVFVLFHINNNPSLANTHFPNSFSLPLEDQIYDPIAKRTRVIRVVSGEKSIYKDEQSEDGQKARYMSKMFSKRGELIVEARETQTLEWMMKSNKNGSNPNRDKTVQPLFYLFNPQIGFQTDVKNYKLEAEAVNWCYSDNTKFKHILRYARVLGVNTNEDADLIKHQMAQLAKKDPQKFLDGLKNEYTIRKFYLLEAVEKGILVVDLRSNTIAFANGQIILASPVGKNPVDHLVDVSKSDATFDLTYRNVKEQVEPTDAVDTIVQPTKIEVPKSTGLEDKPNMLDVNISIDDLIEKAIKKGVITRKSSWFIYLDNKYQGKKMNEAIESDANLKESIIRACNEVK